MVPMTLGVCRETVPGERRVALVPDSVQAVQALGLNVLVETGFGASAWMPDRLYRNVGADVTTRADLFARADILVGVRPPFPPVVSRFRRGQTVIALLDPLSIPFQVRCWADEGVTAIGLDLAPGASVLARPMDTVASQGRIAGHRAALLAADCFGRPLSASDGSDFPEPVRALVIGADVTAGQAADTLRRLGAEVLTGDTFLDGARLPEHTDIVITADRPRPPGRPPVHMTASAIARMRPGSVIVDTAVGPDGGNVEGARPEAATTVDPGVTVVGAGRLAESAPRAASIAYAHNVTALLEHIVCDGNLLMDPADPVMAAMMVTHRGLVLHGAVWQLILDQTALAGLP